MDINTNQVSSLLGGSVNSSNAGVYGAIIEPKQDVTKTALSGLTGGNQKQLTSTQSSALDNLRNFVNDNVSGPNADTLLQSISALESFITNGNKAANLDPVFSLLSSNSDIIENPEIGLFVDQTA
jgi:hypothetical protein